MTWNGTSFIASSISNIASDGMSKATLENIFNEYSWALGNSFGIIASLNTTKANMTPYIDSITWTVLQSANKLAGHIITDSSVSYNQRANLQFKGSGVSISTELS